MDNNVIDVIGIKLNSINLFPKTKAEEIAQNIKIILTTVKGSVPLDRRFGLDVEFLDDPSPRAMMKFAIFILESIHEYEPRVEVKEIDFVPDTENALDGKLYPRVKVVIIDE